MMTRPLIVAELSANHNQNLEIAKKSLIAIKECGANAIKLQTYTPECLTLNCTDECFQINSGTLWDGKTLYELYQEAYMPWEWHNELFALARSLDLIIFSSPFSLKALELLEQLDCPMYKIASFEITDTNLIYEVAKTHKPIIISTGIATEEEIKDALDMCKKAGNSDITLLKCTSSYPAPLQEANLLSMPQLGEKYNVKYGLSDHTQGYLSAIIATTLGANMIEKHFILDKKLGGVDADFSLDKLEFEEMVQAINSTILALGNKEPKIDLKKLTNQRKFARSLFVSKNIKKGEVLSMQNIQSVRPNNGLAPKYLKDIIGKKANTDLKFGKPLQIDDFS
ncbi:pseudaminic acid synthase [Helicobacter cappadocius]|uniref:Pseudaminic acid synthase n=1 Tax=Helicobacter cappadocius TaxID=3063998 RepID=A0AA90PL95_9HELI|nr:MULTISPECIES: pseudaminic acid synthase [unclassified Helicobacter]MDO7253356.1 pseudaminic acid synthase [Helicobacter sp. faydin-H75]MDP2539214.1 pseudaminic acid synthase [Helicobacter sp. faydin-H76]